MEPKQTPPSPEGAAATQETPGLTSYTRFSGCGAKLGPGTLEKALCGLRQPDYPGFIAGFNGYEDSGLFRLSDDLALAQTVDFFPPIVDDPFLFGRIAAANALSDIYAMGGKPITALALVCFPVKTLGLETLRRMMEGGLNALSEAGCALVGGHSINDSEPKLGYAVTGTVHPDRAWRNNALRPGFSLILTKPIGTGLVNMAVRAGIASAEAASRSEASMSRLNKDAAEILADYRTAACTDVTGFGLAGHAAEMVTGAPCGIRLFVDAVPLIPGIREYVAMGLVPEGTWRNKEGRLRAVRGWEDLPGTDLDILFDPQTSGGLLAALPPSEAPEALARLKEAGLSAAIVGECAGPSGEVEFAR